MPTHPRAAASTAPGPPSATALRGRGLLLARGGWLAVALIAVGLYVIGVPPYLAAISRICTAPAEICAGQQQLTPDNLRQLRALGLSPDFWATFHVATRVMSAAIWCAIGAVIFARKADDRMALLVALWLVIFGTNNGPRVALAAAHPAWWLPVQAAAILSWVLFACFFALFPNGRFVPRGARWLPVAWVLWLAPGVFFPDSPFSQQQLPSWLVFGGWTSLIGGTVALQVYRYRRVSTPAERQQTKWVVLGMAGFLASLIAGLVVLALDPSLLTTISLKYFVVQVGTNGVASLFLPLSIGVAILRSRLFDIDVLINRALVYGVLTAMLGLIYSGVVVLSQRLMGALTGEVGQSPLAIIASTLAIAALFQPLLRRVQVFIDRRFYRRKYDAARTLAAFSATLRDETDLDQLRAHLLTVVDETMQPEHVSLWLRPTTPEREHRAP